MNDKTTRLAAIRSRAEAFETASMGNGVGAAYDSAADVPFLLSLVDQLQGQLDAIRALPEIEIGLHWNAHSEAEASGRNATLREVRRVLDDGEPPRAGRTQTEVRDDFNRALRSLRVSSSDCGGAPGDR